MLNRGHYPYKWLWDYAGDKFLKPKAHKNFHRCRPTTYYYFYARAGRRAQLGPGGVSRPKAELDIGTDTRRSILLLIY